MYENICYTLFYANGQFDFRSRDSSNNNNNNSGS